MAFLDLFTFSIPFKTPPVVKNSYLTKREGVLIYARNEKILAEASPLPGYSIETIPEVLSELKNYYSSAGAKLPYPCLSPSTAFAIFSLNLLLKNSHHAPNITSRHFLTHQKSIYDLKDLILQLDHQAKKCFILKIKVGNYSIDELTIVLSALIKRLKFAKLQLDFNSSLSLESCIQFLKPFSSSDFYSIEDPLSLPAELYELRKHSTHPLSLDESLRTLPLAFFENLTFVKSYEFKPSLDFKKLTDPSLYNHLKKKNIKLTLSSSYETSIGIKAITNLGSHFFENVEYGIDTLDLFDQSCFKTIENPFFHPFCQHHAQIDLPYLQL